MESTPYVCRNCRMAKQNWFTPCLHAGAHLLIMELIEEFDRLSVMSEAMGMYDMKRIADEAVKKALLEVEPPTA